MDITPNFILSVLLSVIALVSWAVRIESKVYAHEREIDQLRKETLRVVDEVRKDLTYVRERLDELILNRHAHP